MTTEASGNQVAKNQLMRNETAFYLKTAPDDFISENIFQNNQVNIRFTDEWAPVEDGPAVGASYFERLAGYFAFGQLLAR